LWHFTFPPWKQFGVSITSPPPADYRSIAKDRSPTPGYKIRSAPNSAYSWLNARRFGLRVSRSAASIRAGPRQREQPGAPQCSQLPALPEAAEWLATVFADTRLRSLAVVEFYAVSAESVGRHDGFEAAWRIPLRQLSWLDMQCGACLPAAASRRGHGESTPRGAGAIRRRPPNDRQECSPGSRPITLTWRRLSSKVWSMKFEVPHPVPMLARKPQCTVSESRSVSRLRTAAGYASRPTGHRRRGHPRRIHTGAGIPPAGRSTLPRSVADVADKSARHEGLGDEQRTAQIKRWCEEALNSSSMHRSRPSF
jgi:hypothetical protein